MIGMLIVVLAIIVWMVFMMKNNWLGGNGISESLNPNNSTNTEAPRNTQEINAQLNDLRQDVKALQDKKDKEILDELNK